MFIEEILHAKICIDSTIDPADIPILYISVVSDTVQKCILSWVEISGIKKSVARPFSIAVTNCSEKIKLVGPKVRIGRDATIGRMASIQIDGSIEPECFFSF